MSGGVGVHVWRGVVGGGGGGGVHNMHSRLTPEFLPLELFIDQHHDCESCYSGTSPHLRHCR